MNFARSTKTLRTTYRQEGYNKMTISFAEREGRRSVTQDEDYSLEVEFVVTTNVSGEIVDESTVRKFAILNMPLVIDGIPRNAITAIDRVNPDFYYVKLAFLSLDPLDEEDEEIEEGPTDSFDTTGGTELITYGIERASSAGNPSSELGAAINYDGEKVNGVEITVPRYGFTRTVKFLDSYITNAFKKELYEATGTTNLTKVEFFAENEVLFLGARGSKTVTFDDIEDEWEITYHFQGQKKRKDIVFNEGLEDEFTIALKDGWDYIWVQYEDIEDKGQEKIVKKAIAAYVIRVYRESLFSLLGFIG